MGQKQVTKQTRERIARQRKYINNITTLNIVSVIQMLPKQELKQLIHQAATTGGGQQKKSPADILDKIIDIQCNISMGNITEKELFFLRQQKKSLATFIQYVQEYRVLLKNALPNEYKQLQQQYRIERKKILDDIRQQCLQAQELETAIDNISNNPRLLTLNEQMRIIRAHNPAVRNIQIALYKMSAGHNAHQQLTEQYKSKKIIRQKQLTLINSDDFILTAKKLLTGSLTFDVPTKILYIHNIMMGICALTGRRPVEIIKTGNFAYNDDYSLEFTGQAKTQNIPKPTFEIPTLCHSREIIAAHKHLKTVIENHPLGNPELSNKQINQRIYSHSQLPRNLLHKTFQFIYPADQIPEKISLRSIYGEICYEIFQPDMSKHQYLEQILGHSNSTSADSYVRNKIIQGEQA